jgi:cellulose synthase/poly-beta-1,6-N-acetylglucosamine synthase-like glycosyltransferase
MMTSEAIFTLCAALSVISGILVLFPYVLYPTILRMLPAVPVRADAMSLRKPKVTLVFCAFNEARVIGEKLQNLEVLKAAYPDLECLAYDDGSTDATLELMRQRPDLLTVIRGAGRTGKAHGMKLLAARAQGDIIVFTDANVTLKTDAIDRIVAYYTDPNVGGICGTLRYIGAEGSVTARVGGAYWRLEEYLKSLESRTGNVMGADGSIFSLRRELYPSFPDSVLDDLTVSMAAVFAGKRLVRAPDVIAFECLVESREDEFARKVRIAARAFHTHRYLLPQLRKMRLMDKFKYMSRKYIRWFGALFLGIGFLTTCIGLWTISPWLAGFAAAGIASLLYAGAKLRLGPLSAIVEIILALTATLIGVGKAMRGETVVTWNPAKSR